MAQTTDNCEALRNEILQVLDGLEKQFETTKLDKDMEYIQKFENEFQVKAYAEKVRKEWIIYIMKNLSKLVAGISTVFGAISALIQIFVP